MFDPQQNNQSIAPTDQNQLRLYDMEESQANRIVSKSLALLSCLFVITVVGLYTGINLILGINIYMYVTIVGIAILLIIQFISVYQKVSLFLLFLFMFFVGFVLGPIFNLYLTHGNALGKFFLTATITLAGLAVYTWIAKRKITQWKYYLSFTVILLLAVGIVEIFFRFSLLSLILSILITVIFCYYIFFRMRHTKYIVGTQPNAIGLVISFFTLNSILLLA